MNTSTTAQLGAAQCSPTTEALKARLAELYAKQEAATGWGAAVGARHEEIKAIESQLRALEAPRSSPDIAIAALAERFWRVHPKEIQDLGITRQQFYEREMKSLFASLNAATETPIPLADHDEIGRKVVGQPWAIQAAIVTICAHCRVLVDNHPTGVVADLAGCISENCVELANALSSHLAQTAAWQPIETAPKDGTPVDLFSVSGRRWCDYRWDKEIRSGMWSLASAAGLHWKDRPSLLAASMTHWMPVPASPVSSTDRSPIMQAADKAARVVEGWSDAKRDYADRVTDSSPVGWGGHLPGKIEP